MSRRLLLALPLLAATLPLPSQTHATPWQMETSGTTASLRGIHAVGGGVAWASGTGGTVLRTEDSGYMWQSCAMPPGAEKLDFRAIWAWDANTAIVMSSGQGGLSRLYKTTDGCSHWKLVEANGDHEGFWDSLFFRDEYLGLILGDPTLGDRKANPDRTRTIQLRYTNDGGESWHAVRSFATEAQPIDLQASVGEGFFAASNSSMFMNKDWLWLGSSGNRVLRKGVNDRDFRPAGVAGAVDEELGIPVIWTGWQSAQTPLAQGSPFGGIFSLAFRNVQQGLAVGGDYTKPTVRAGTAAWTGDNGKSWTASSTPPGGYRSAVAWDLDHQLWIAVGPNGSDLSRDDGRTWQPIEHAPANSPKGGEWNALSLPWVVGPNGRIAKLNAEALPKTAPASK